MPTIEELNAFFITTFDWELLPKELILIQEYINKIIDNKGKEIKIDTRLNIGEITMDLLKRKCWLNNKCIYLTKTQFNLLFYLIKNKDKVNSYEELAENVWRNENVSNNSISVHIKNMRKIIDKGRYTYIQTVNGVGYQIELLEKLKEL